MKPLVVVSQQKALKAHRVTLAISFTLYFLILVVVVAVMSNCCEGCSPESVKGKGSGNALERRGE